MAAQHTPSPVPRFFFSVQQAVPSSTHRPRGDWVPPRRGSDNILQQAIYFACNGVQIGEVDPASPEVWPYSREHFRTYSVYNDNGRLWVVDYDALSPGVLVGRGNDDHYMPWRELMFFWNPLTTVSRLLGVGDEYRLQVQHPNQVWARRLLPRRYQTQVAERTMPGGLCGHLPLLLALIVLAYPPAQIPQAMGFSLQHGQWRFENWEPQRNGRRAVLVRVFTWLEQSTRADLEGYEDGVAGPIFA